ncbi:MAG: lipid-A-disaccharide synthase, partial [Candidatus Adiutrix sp.]|nr:lipid-A-disaccharide synthase [Candidatus Adiutrix sp.]
MISAGESSGEIHGAALMKAARAKGFDWRFLGLGGDRMAAEGARLIGHVRDTAVMGLTEVLGSLRRILAVRAAMMKSLELDRPNALVLIDSPDFNFPLATRAQELGIPVIYYICPQVWAWREKRLEFLARHTSRRAVIFEFEKKFYEERGVGADWVGHPVLDELPPPAPREMVKAALGFDPDRKLLALMPGSRRKVVSRLAPGLLQAAELLLRKDDSLQLVLPLADSLEPEFMGQFVAAAGAGVREKIRVIPGRSRDILAGADLALLASGTSSVEATFL